MFLTQFTIKAAEVTLVDLRNSFWRYNDSGTDLGSMWRMPMYNDTGWASGRGVFGKSEDPVITPLTNTILRLTNAVAGFNVATFYFRTTFQLTNDPRLVSLTFSNVIDDGAVVYLNGAEIYRINIAEQSPNSQTLASRSASNAVCVVTNLSPEQLVSGTNFVAVELHQVNPLSADAVMGLSITAASLPVTPLVVTGLDPNATIEDGKPFSVTAQVSGTPAFFQWYKDGVTIPGARSRTLYLPAMYPTDSGRYHYVVTNAISAVSNLYGTVVVVATDTNPPTLLDADRGSSSSKVTVTFSEPITLQAATNVANYRITNTITGAFIAVQKAEVTNANKVVLTTAGMNTTDNYILVVNQVRDTSLQQNVIVSNSSVPIGFTAHLFPMDGTVYRYYQPQYPPPLDQPDQGTAWRETGFLPPMNWPFGTSPLVYSVESYDDLPVEPQTILGEALHLTSYYRATGTANFSPSGTRLFLRHFVADGVVMYLNGQEAYRFNMPATNDSTTPALVANESEVMEGIELTATALRQGQNLLAVELHQSTPWDPFVAMALQVDVRARSRATGPVVITGGPSSVTVDEGQPVSLEAIAAGGETFQWQTSVTNIPGATNPVLHIAAVPISMDNKSFRVRVANQNGFLFSSNASIRVRPDTTPSSIVGVVARYADNTITVSFSERLDLASATNLSNYTVTNGLGQLRTIVSATLQNGTNVVLTFASLPVADYTLTARNVRDASAAGNQMLSSGQWAVGRNDVVQSMDGVWQYDAAGIDRGTNWAHVNYDTSAWSGSGLALIGGDERGPSAPQPPEPVRTPIDPKFGGNEIVTFYFRHSFQAVAGTGTLTARILVDDGCVIYLNGLEIYRRGMRAGTVLYNTFAARTVGVPIVEGPFQIAVTNLRQGTNVLAVEVHQAAHLSPDAYWGGEFRLEMPSYLKPPPPDCVPLPWQAPVLNVLRLASNLMMLSWVHPLTNTGPCFGRAIFTLQATPEWKTALITDPLVGPWNPRPGPNISVWTNLTTNSPCLITTTNQMQFYRLRQLP